VPWTYAGPGTAEHPGWNDLTAAGSAAVGLQWLGTFAEWTRRAPPVAFRERLMLSALNPLTGQGRFFLVINGTGRVAQLDALTDWMQFYVGSQQLVAVHGEGADVGIRQGSWWLGGRPEARGVKAPGTVVALTSRLPGDRVDVGRLYGTVEATSREFAHPPDQVVSGRLWATGLRPSVWVSRPTEAGSGEYARLSLRMEQPRAIEEIQLIHAEGAGWSAEFNPRRLQIRVYGQNALDAPLVIDHETGGEGITRVRFGAPRTVTEIGVEWTRPTAFDVPAPARLMALQAWGRLGE
jgi:hypothetical protein